MPIAAGRRQPNCRCTGTAKIGDESQMKAYKHILTHGETKDGRLYISRIAQDELMRTLGQVRDRPFNIFRSDGKLLVRTAFLQRQKGKAGLRINCGQDTFANCREGTPIWLRLRPDGDVEIQIGSSPGPIIDAELSHDCEAVLEDPEAVNFWQAVNAACIILESRLRSRARAPKTMHGKRLVEYALGHPDGRLKCRENGGEQEGICQLCHGVMRSLRNPSLHQKQEYSRTRARQIVGIVDLLLEEIGAAQF